MPDLSSIFNRDLLQTVIGRLIRSLISLLIFQFAFFALLSALPQNYVELQVEIFGGSRGSTIEERDLPAEEVPVYEVPEAEVITTEEIETERLAVEQPLVEISAFEGISIEMDMPPVEYSPVEEPAEPPATDEPPTTAEDPAIETPSHEEPIQEQPVAEAQPEESLASQFFEWMKGFYSGNLGESRSFITIQGSRSVWEHLKIRLPKTLLLLLPGTLLGFWFGIWLGKRVAWGRKGWLDFMATFGGTAFYSAFPPWLAFVAVQVFGLSLNWFPPEKPIDYNKWLFQDVTVDGIIWKMLITAGIGLFIFWIITNLPRRIIRMNARRRTIIGFVIAILAAVPWITSGLWPFPVDILYHLVLPLSTLVLLSFGETMIVMKTSMVEIMESDHVAAAKGRGLEDAMVRDKHVARLSVLPVLSRFIVHLPFVLIGSFVLESFFYWDGIGQALFKAVQENDLPFLMSTLSLVGIGILIGHIILDIITVRLDPRLRKLDIAD